MRSEKEKYEAIWNKEAYRDFSPSEVLLGKFLEISGATPPSTVREYGCGTGRAMLELHKKGFDVRMIDLVDNCLDSEVKNVLGKKFSQEDICAFKPKLKVVVDYGICCDVMEHLPVEYTMLALSNMARYCRHIFFSIAHFPDHFGQEIGQELHLTVMPYAWWLDHLKQIGEILDARDMILNSIYYVRTG